MFQIEIDINLRYINLKMKFPSSSIKSALMRMYEV